jgi:hypothetical protein
MHSDRLQGGLLGQPKYDRVDLVRITCQPGAMLAGRKPGDFFVLAHQLNGRAALVSLLRGVDPDRLRPCGARSQGIWQLGCIGDLADRGARPDLAGQFASQHVQAVHGAVHF